jgi:hypothetical protein
MHVTTHRDAVLDRDHEVVEGTVPGGVSPIQRTMENFDVPERLVRNS